MNRDTRDVRARSPRPGFTLVELLVAVSLIILLVALAAAMFPGLANSQKVVRSADRVSGWLMVSKARALRDGAPRGLRFYLQPDPANTANSFVCTEAQYIESPDPWVPNPEQEARPTKGRIVIVQRTLPSPPAPVAGTIDPTANEVYFVSDDTDVMNEFNLRVQGGTGIMLVLPEFGQSFRIDGVTTPPVAPNHVVAQGTPLGIANARRLVLATNPVVGAASSPPPPMGSPWTATHVTYKFAFQDPPRTLMGEPILLLGANTIIDFRAPLTVPPNPTGTPPYTYAPTVPSHPQTTLGVQMVTVPPPPAAPQERFIDVLFSPTGQVVGNPSGLICLWMRDPELTTHPRWDPNSPGTHNDQLGHDAAGEQVLVVIYTRTGLVATQPVAPSADPWQYAKDGMNVGL